MDVTKNSVLPTSSGRKSASGMSAGSAATRCAQVMCDWQHYCEKKSARNFQCERCDSLEGRYNQVKKLIIQQQLSSDESPSRKKISVQQRIIRQFEQKCNAYRRTSRPQALFNSSITGLSSPVRSFTARSAIRNSSYNLMSMDQLAAPSAQIAPTKQVQWSKNDAAVWSKTDRDVLLIVSCTSVIVQVLLLFILLLIFFRFVYRRNSYHTYSLRHTNRPRSIVKTDNSKVYATSESRSKAGNNEELRRIVGERQKLDLDAEGYATIPTAGASLAYNNVVGYSLGNDSGCASNIQPLQLIANPYFILQQSADTADS